MPRATKTWADKKRAKPPHTVTLDKDFAGVPAGSRLLISCPVSTAIFLRTVAEAGWDEIEAGKAVAEVAPFWRVIDPKSPLARKLRAGSQWIEQQRQAESSMSEDRS